MNYRVVWEIDVDAACPLEAAKKAREAQLREGTTATIFDVFRPPEKGPIGGRFVMRVDAATGKRVPIPREENG